MQKVIVNADAPSLAILAAVELTHSHYPLAIDAQPGHATAAVIDDQLHALPTVDVLRAIARTAVKQQLYGASVVHKTLVDQWLAVARQPAAIDVAALDEHCARRTFLVAERLTIADLAVFEALRESSPVANGAPLPANVQRWWDLVARQPAVKAALAKCRAPGAGAAKSKPASKKVAGGAKKDTPTATGDRKQEGTFIDLPGAVHGHVVVRFPPEASGYLHIGHAKAALLNQYYAQAYGGKLIMRFDDTNPAKETVEFEQVILEDLKLLQIEPDVFTHTSDYFDLMLGMCEQLIGEGLAYVDDTPAEQMKAERDERTESRHRRNTPEQNFAMWREMCAGTAAGQRCCVRAKIDMQSPNGCLRDPTIYRCKDEPHPKTGTKYRVYPTYDFACPIVDAIENVTHTLRTTEYHDRDDQFYWFIEALRLRRPEIWSYSRLNMTNTVLSKRKLTWFVAEGLVDGWDDARFPTVRGILRHGMTVQGLKEFIIAQGSSKSVVFMEWDKIWTFNKKVIDPVAPRYTALEAVERTVAVRVHGQPADAELEVALHPKNAAVGRKRQRIGPRLRIDAADAAELRVGEMATFINWGNMLVEAVERDARSGAVVAVDVRLRLDNTDFKKTLKLTWLAESEADGRADWTPVRCVYFEHIISKPVLGRGEDFKDYIAKDTRVEVEMCGEPALRGCREGDIIQLTRRGFFRVDRAFRAESEHTGRVGALVLFAIPDGHAKAQPTSGQPKQAATAATPTTKATPAANDALNAKVAAQGDLVRDLKTKKAAKPEIEAAVKQLLALKAEFKQATGQDWKPPTAAPAPAAAAAAPVASNNDALNTKVAAQGDLVRDLKTKKAAKPEIDAAVKQLLALKVEYKQATGQDWKPSTAAPVAAAAASAATNNDALNAKVAAQGDLVRDLKAKKAAKPEIDAAVKQLLALKAEFKQVTGQDWKPSAAAPAAAAAPVVASSANDALSVKVAAQGDLVRDLKAKKAAKPDIEAAVKQLLALKAEYKQATGQDWKPTAASASTAAPAAAATAANVLPALPVAPVAAHGFEALHARITAQGEHVRNLKAKKAVKADIDRAVQELLALKAEYKNSTGSDWKPAPVAPNPSLGPLTANDVTALTIEINEKIIQRACELHDLKHSEAPPPADRLQQIAGQLRGLKLDYISVAGREWQLGCVPGDRCRLNPKRLLENIDAAIRQQGEHVRDLKAKKAPKPAVDAAVSELLECKAEWTGATGSEWSTSALLQAALAAFPSESLPEAAAGAAATPLIPLGDLIRQQGDTVRQLKSLKNVERAEVDAAVRHLLLLKSEYKTRNGVEWTPEATQPKKSSEMSSPAAAAISDRIVVQGDLVRDLKAKKAAKADIDAAVKQLLALKLDFKQASGAEWKPKPAAAPAASAAPAAGAPDGSAEDPAKAAIVARVNAQSEAVRSLKAAKAEAGAVKAAVDQLLALKAEYKQVTGTDFPVAGRGGGGGAAKPAAAAAAPAKPKAAKAPKAAAKPAASAADNEAAKKQTRLGLEATKADNLPEWYSQVITKSEMIEYYDVSGCYILRPHAIAVWRTIQNFFQDEITKLGVKECYFPMFVSKAALEKEKEHIADFSPEVAWVTRSGDSELSEPIAIRPTSETIMYPAFAKWIQSYRDLPLKLNQWSNVVRWEFKHPQPFLRTREFLWQEGHTAHADLAGAEAEVLDILRLYARIYEELLAIPVRRGRKSEKEKFAGGNYTTTVEAFVSASGRSIQGATSHHLGQNFSRMFDIIYEDPQTQEKRFVYQNSWGITTRTIGVMIMVHGDDKGLVMPPRVAPVQAVIVPCGITVATTAAERAELQRSLDELEAAVRAAGVRVEGDYRDNYSPGWKFNHWELKGVPVRVELGPKDMRAGQLVLVRRDTGAKEVVQRADVAHRLPALLEEIQANMFARAQKDFVEHMVQTRSWPEFKANLELKNLLCSPFCGGKECEDQIKENSAITEPTEPGAMLTGAKSLCIPFDQPAPIVAGDRCINPLCSAAPKHWCYFGRSY